MFVTFSINATGRAPTVIGFTDVTVAGLTVTATGFTTFSLNANGMVTANI